MHVPSHFLHVIWRMRLLERSIDRIQTEEKESQRQRQRRTICSVASPSALFPGKDCDRERVCDSPACLGSSARDYRQSRPCLRFQWQATSSRTPSRAGAQRRQVHPQEARLLRLCITARLLLRLRVCRFILKTLSLSRPASHPRISIEHWSFRGPRTKLSVDHAMSPRAR